MALVAARKWAGLTGGHHIQSPLHLLLLLFNQVSYSYPKADNAVMVSQGLLESMGGSEHLALTFWWLACSFAPRKHYKKYTLMWSNAVAKSASTRKWTGSLVRYYTLMEYERDVTASIVAFCAASENSGDPLSLSSWILATPLRLRGPMGSDGHLITSVRMLFCLL
ncbi:hypothetical protein EVAR_13313_1 [Eumeta japonica]|uniref:Uncharacterized protein n=1 Tax=Eumeta variegata TaxID=151549 RepID=A0A4C1TRT0_EUMVA|nr:hypothetical protein EVAR_13313_1 [Eumeta japonica]